MASPAADVAQERVHRRQLPLAADQRRRCRRRGRCVGQEAVAQLARLVAGRHAKLAAQRAVEALELAQRGMAIAGRGVLAHQLDVGALVARFQLDDVAPPPGQPQEVEVPQAKLLAPFLGPLLVAVLGRQLARVEPEGAAGGVGVTLGQRTASGVLEGVDVDLRVDAGEQVHHVVPQHHGVGQARRLAGVVRGLVQLGAGLVERVVRPDEVDDLLAVELAVRSEGQHLDQRRGMAAAPAPRRHGVAVDGDLEAAEELHLDPGHRHSFLILADGYGTRAVTPITTA